MNRNEAAVLIACIALFSMCAMHQTGENTKRINSAINGCKEAAKGLEGTARSEFIKDCLVGSKK